MGQYYKAAKLDENGRPLSWVLPHVYDNGLKLMEHSYIGNEFMRAVEGLLIPSGSWYKTSIVWAGDYADAIRDGGVKLKDSEGYDVNIYTLCTDEIEVKPTPLAKGLSKKYRYIVNFDRKEYLDKEACPDYAPFGTGWKLHPLSLLTADGNGRGGGDYSGEQRLVGYWAKDRIGLEKEIPERFSKLSGIYFT